ncbi:MAG: hypothetical protein ACLP7Q_01635 [Isosphaeraceae bacterium]
MNAHVDCDCGNGFTGRDDQLDKSVKCPFCGKRHRVGFPSTNGEEEPTDRPRDVSAKRSREPLLWVGFALGLAILVAIGIAIISRVQRVNADRYVAEKVSEATALIAERRPEEAIGLLEEATGTSNASNLSSASRLLKKARAVMADLEDAKLIEKAERSITVGEVEAAVRSLSARVSAMVDPNKARALAIIEDVRRVTSGDSIVRNLSALSDGELVDASAVNSLILKFETKYESLRGIYRRNILAAIPGERARRDEAKRKAEAERLARAEDERLKRLEEERIAKEAEEKRAAEKARIAEERKTKEAVLAAREERRMRSFKGFGQEATRGFSLAEGLAVVKLRHRGASNFIVALVNDAGDRVLTFANVIGSCSMSRAVRVPRDGEYLLNVKAEGVWEITNEQPLPRETEFAFFFDGEETSATRQFKLLEGLCRIKLKHRGESNFIVTLLDENGVPVSGIVNEIGSYEGSQAVKIERTGTYILDVTAGGPWSIEIE